MRVKLIANVLHNGRRMLSGALVELSDADASRLIAGGVAVSLCPPAPEAPKPSLSPAIKPAEPPVSSPKVETYAQAEKPAKKAVKKTAAKRKKAAP